MDKKLIDYFWRSGITYQSNVQAWLTQGIADGGTPPSTTVLNALSAFFTSLNGYGLLTNLVTFNVLHAGSKEFVKLNVKNPATYKYVESGTVTLSDGNGCKSDGSSYFNQPFTSNEYAGIESSLTVSQYISGSNTTALDQSSHGMKTNNTNSYCLLRPRRVTATNGVNQHYDVANPFVSANHKAFFIHTNNGTTNFNWRDNVEDSTAIVPVAPIATNNRFVLARNNAGTPEEFYTASTVALDMLFNVAFDTTKAGNLYTAFQTYKTAVSLP